MTEENKFTGFTDSIIISDSTNQNNPSTTLTSTRELIGENTYQNVLDVNTDIKATWESSGSTTSTKMSLLYGNINKENGCASYIESDLTNNQKIQSTFKTEEELEQEIATTVQSYIMNGIGNDIYHIGAIYLSLNNTNPSILFGGVWEEISYCFLYCQTGASEQSGGSKFHDHQTYGHAITVGELPSHTHHLSTSNGNITVTSNTHHHTIGKCYDTFAGDGTNSTDECSGSERTTNLLTTFSNGEHTHTLSTTTGNKGAGATHSHGLTNTTEVMPPYITVYCWKRIN